MTNDIRRGDGRFFFTSQLPLRVFFPVSFRTKEKARISFCNFMTDSSTEKKASLCFASSIEDSRFTDLEASVSLTSFIDSPLLKDRASMSSSGSSSEPHRE